MDSVWPMGERVSPAPPPEVETAGRGDPTVSSLTVRDPPSVGSKVVLKGALSLKYIRSPSFSLTIFYGIIS